MACVLEVVPHPTGPWLVKAGPVHYAVPGRLGRALQPLAGRSPARGEIAMRLAADGRGPGRKMTAPEIEVWAGLLAAALHPGPAACAAGLPRRSRARPIRFRVPLAPAPLVRRAAGALPALAGNRGLTVLALGGVAGCLLGTAGAAGRAPLPWPGSAVAAGVGLFLLSALWHELGHAAGLARSGYPPGGIGAGLLFVIPVLFADVTAVGALPRAGRIRVDVSGVIFQAAAAGGFLALAAWPGMAPFWVRALTLAGSSALLAVSWSLFPFIRSDGYWLLCDLLGLDDLDRPPARRVRLPLRLFLTCYQLANAVFLLGIGIYFPLRMAAGAAAWARRLGVALPAQETPWLGGAAALACLGLMGPGLARRVSVLIRSATAVARGRGSVPGVSRPRSS